MFRCYTPDGLTTFGVLTVGQSCVKVAAAPVIVVVTAGPHLVAEILLVSPCLHRELLLQSCGARTFVPCHIRYYTPYRLTTIDLLTTSQLCVKITVATVSNSSMPSPCR
jgi:hypothetical protein